MFHADNIRLKPPPARLKELQDKLAQDMNDRYLEFEKTGWWWYRALNEQAVILEIVPPTGSDELRSHVNAYHDNIGQTVNVLQEMWRACVDAGYDYQDARFTQIQEKMNKGWNDADKARNQVVNDWSLISHNHSRYPLSRTPQQFHLVSDYSPLRAPIT